MALPWKDDADALETVETIIHLAEIRLAGKTGSLRFKPELSEDDVRRLLNGERPSFIPPERDTEPSPRNL